MKRLPLSCSHATELQKMFKAELELCKVKPGETVIVYTDPKFNPFYPAAMFGAALELGADAYQVVVPSTGATGPDVTDKEISRARIEMLKSADMLIEMTNTRWLLTDAHAEILQSGTRALLCYEPPEVLQRLFPCEEVNARSLAGAKVLTEGKQVRVTSDAGTDISYDITGRTAKAAIPIADEPGRWAHWPSGMSLIHPIEESAEGTVVVDRGDLIFRLHRYIEQPVKLTVREGQIVKIEGGTDARLLDNYLAHWNDERAYMASHIGWGTDHRAQWFSHIFTYHEGGGVMDPESYLGNVMLAFGGGPNVRTPAHIDFPMLNTNFYVDDELIVEKGVIVKEECK
jgi:2,5-dihydroxypyridine 5,6-dioxygenase